MAYDAIRFSASTAQPSMAARADFRRLERLVVLTGGASVGAGAGFILAIALGRMELWSVIVLAAPLMAAALYLVAQTLQEGMTRNAIGCTTAAILHAAALLAWPMTSLFASLSAAVFWIAPAAAIATLVLFASCWSGPARAIYRLGGQAAVIAALAVHQGLLVALGN